MQVILQILAVTVFLFLTYEFLRYAGKWVSWGLFLLVPLALTPYWLRVNDFDYFQWIKIYSIFLCICWNTILRFTSFGNRPWICFTLPLSLLVNIFEATTLDLFGQGLAHSLNAATGALLMVTLPYSLKSTWIDSASRCRDLQYGASLGWILGYILWNWTFVYLNYPSLAGHHTAVLAAGLIVAVIDTRQWAQGRSYTLGVNLLISATFYADVVSWMDTTSWFEERLGILAGGISLSFVVGCSLWERMPALRRMTCRVSLRS